MISVGIGDPFIHVYTIWQVSAIAVDMENAASSAKSTAWILFFMVSPLLRGRKLIVFISCSFSSVLGFSFRFLGMLRGIARGVPGQPFLQIQTAFRRVRQCRAKMARGPRAEKHGGPLARRCAYTVPRTGRPGTETRARCVSEADGHRCRKPGSRYGGGYKFQECKIPKNTCHRARGTPLGSRVETKEARAREAGPPRVGTVEIHRAPRRRNRRGIAQCLRRADTAPARLHAATALAVPSQSPTCPPEAS